MGHARAQLLHLTHLSSTCMLRYFSGSGAVRGETHDDNVPIGQKEHHVRGAYTNDNTTPTTVVTRMIVQNTRPAAAQSPQA